MLCIWCLISAVCKLPCQHGGKCIAPNVCRCRLPYSGPQCTKKRKEWSNFSQDNLHFCNFFYVTIQRGSLQQWGTLEKTWQLDFRQLFVLSILSTCFSIWKKVLLIVRKLLQISNCAQCRTPFLLIFSLQAKVLFLIDTLEIKFSSNQVRIDLCSSFLFFFPFD